MLRTDHDHDEHSRDEGPQLPSSTGPPAHGGEREPRPPAISWLSVLGTIGLATGVGAACGFLLLLALWGDTNMAHAAFMPGWFLALVVGGPGGAIVGIVVGAVLSIVKWRRSRSGDASRA